MAILLVLMLAALLATASRMGVAATLIGAMLASGLVLRKSGRGGRPWMRLLLLIGASAVILLLLVFGIQLLDRSIFVSSDAELRLGIYRVVLQMIGERPFLGTGLDTFEIAIHNFYGPPLSPDRAWDRTHSTYLSHWSEMGLLAGSFPMVILLLLAWRFARRDLAAGKDYLMSIVAIAVIAQTAIHSLVDFSLEMPANVYLFSLILALAFGRSAPRQKKTG